MYKEMPGQIQTRELSTSDINGILIELLSFTTEELRGFIKIMAADLKLSMRMIRYNFEEIDKLTKKYFDVMSERRNFFNRCHELATEISSLKNKLARVEMCELCKKCP